jgi:hypothetical protein
MLPDGLHRAVISPIPGKRSVTSVSQLGAGAVSGRPGKTSFSTHEFSLVNNYSERPAPATKADTLFDLRMRPQRLRPDGFVYQPRIESQIPCDPFGAIRRVCKGFYASEDETLNAHLTLDAKLAKQFSEAATMRKKLPNMYIVDDEQIVAETLAAILRSSGVNASPSPTPTLLWRQPAEFRRT